MKPSNEPRAPPPYQSPSVESDPEEPMIKLVDQQPARQPLMEEHRRQQQQQQQPVRGPTRATPTTTTTRAANPYSSIRVHYPNSNLNGYCVYTGRGGECVGCGDNSCLECRCRSMPCDPDCCCGVVVWCVVLIAIAAGLWHLVGWAFGLHRATKS